MKNSDTNTILDKLISVLIQPNYIILFSDFERIIEVSDIESELDTILNDAHKNISVIQFDGSNIRKNQSKNLKNKIDSLDDEKKRLFKTRLESIRNSENKATSKIKWLDFYFPWATSILVAVMVFFPTLISNLLAAVSFVLLYFIALLIVYFVIRNAFYRQTSSNNSYTLKYNFLLSFFE